MTQKHLSHAQAAALLGWSAPNVTYYCKAIKPPRAHILAHMATRLGVSEAELLGAAPTALPVVLPDATPGGPPAVGDPWLFWIRALRAAYKRNPDVVASGIRAAWPRREAEQILDWLRGQH